MDKINQIHMKIFFGIDNKEPKLASKKTKKESIFTTTIRGVVTNLRTSVDSNENGTTQIATFRVNNTPVEMRASSSLIIFNGDNVVISGARWLGVLRCYAVKNLDTGSVQYSTSLLAIYLIVTPLVGYFTFIIAFTMYRSLIVYNEEVSSNLFLPIIGSVATGFLLINLIQRISSIFNVSRFKQ